jgi:hypothetical protein
MFIEFIEHFNMQLLSIRKTKDDPFMFRHIYMSKNESDKFMKHYSKYYHAHGDILSSIGSI